MEEEPNEHELAERFYAMLHHVDETQANVNTDTQNDPTRLVENAPRSTVRRYWRTNSENARNTNPYSKVNTPKDSVPAPVSKNPTTTNTNNTKPKEEKNGKPEPAVDLSLFQSPPQIVRTTIEIVEHENQSFESSDEDEVFEVELPPKPSITIESSDEDDKSIVSKPATPSKGQPKNNGPGNAAHTTAEREISVSPVPSVVSSVLDDCIRGDIALKPCSPSKNCVKCGSPNWTYSKMCRNCATWERVMCAECGQRGHPSSHCPDIRRRYPNTRAQLGRRNFQAEFLRFYYGFLEFDT